MVAHTSANEVYFTANVRWRSFWFIAFNFGRMPNTNQAYLPDVVHDFHTAQYQFLVDAVAVRGECHGDGVPGMAAQLAVQASHVLGQLSDLMVEAVYLCSIADDVAERVEVVVELSLDVGRPFHLLARPNMPGGLHQHRPFLRLQLVFRLVGIEVHHPGQGRVYLRLQLQ